MTTYSGRGASYIPGREVVNKEPPVSKYVVEKLYRVHRERVMRVEKTVDTRIVIPDFLLNREWKKNSEKQKQKIILQENQEIYKRIAKLEDNEGHIAKENREHIKRMSSKLDYLRKLKEHGRLVNLIKIQKENEYMLKRLEKAKPQYTLKKCKDWYKHHELFKLGRYRSIACFQDSQPLLTSFCMLLGAPIPRQDISCTVSARCCRQVCLHFQL